MKIAYLGSTGFPKGLADVNKQILISKALIHSGFEVTVICNRTGSNIKKNAPPIKGVFQNINYIYTSLITYNPQNKISRKINKIIGIIRESMFLIFHEFDLFLVNSIRFWDVPRYYLIAKLTGRKIFLTIVEDPDEIGNLSSKIGKYLYKKYYIYSWRLVDAIFPISELLKKRVEQNCPNKPMLKIPPLVDIGLFEQEEYKTRKKYFLFCGAASYFEVINFIIDSFNLIKDNSYELYLVSSGTKATEERIEKEIDKSPKAGLITRIDYLDYRDLIVVYKGASGLLIPLRNNKQDVSRFPQKIGEYSASGNPILSTNFGEMKYYFTHKENALLASNFDIKEFYEIMLFVINNPEKSKSIGVEGKTVCSNYFDYRLYGPRIEKFINMVANN